MAHSSKPELVSPSTSTESQKPPVQPLRSPTLEEIHGQEIWNNCFFCSAASGVMGAGMGVFMGILLGALENPVMQEEMSTKQQIIHSAKQMGSRSFSNAKTFALMGAIYSGVECVVSKARAKQDIKSAAAAGCVTGAVLSAKGGPQAACLGCVGFSAFSVLLEKFLDRHK